MKRTVLSVVVAVLLAAILAVPVLAQKSGSKGAPVRQTPPPLPALAGAGAPPVAPGGQPMVGGGRGAGCAGQQPVGGPQPISRQQPVREQQRPTVSPEALASLFQAIGYSVKVADAEHGVLACTHQETGTIVLVSIIKGVIVRCVAYYSFNDNVPMAQRVAAANACNANAFVGRYYVDSDGDLAVEHTIVAALASSLDQLAVTQAAFEDETQDLLSQNMSDLLK